MTSPKIVWRLLRKYPVFFWSILAVTLATSLVEGLNVAAFFPVFGALLGTGGGEADGLFGLASAWVGRLPFADPVTAAAAFLAGAALLKCVLVTVRESLVAAASGTVQHDVKMRLLERYAQAPYLWLLGAKQGRLQYNVMVAAQRTGQLVRGVPQALAEALKVAAIGLVIASGLPAAVLGLCAVGVVYYALTHYAARRVSYRTSRARAQAGAEQFTIAGDLLSGLRQLRVVGGVRAWLDRFREQSLKQRGYYVKDSVWLVMPRHLMELSVVLLLAGVLTVWHALAPAALMDRLPAVGMLAVAMLQVLPTLTHAGSMRMELSGLLADAEIVDAELSRADLEPPAHGRAVPSAVREAAFDEIGFAYPGQAPLLRAVSFTLSRGQVVALVGPSGSGKTTVVNLLLGLLEPDAGQVLINGQSLRALDPAAWRRRVGFVSQDAFIFHGSVRDNIVCGRSGYAAAAVEDAARIANADEFIRRLPQGYETVVGERGMKLSGGQQQRVAIARAVLGGPDVLIFDEATSALDAESERLVQDAISRIASGRAVFVVAHRLSTVERADQILVLDRGQIVERGGHAELLRGRGRYARLVGAGGAGVLVSNPEEV